MDRLKKHSVNSLRWLERYTKTDMVYLAKGGSWATISQIVVSSSTFLLAIAFANFLPKEVYGQYKYILSLVSILSALTLTGLNTAVLQSVSRGFEGSLNYAFWQNIKWSVLFFIGALLVSIYYFWHGNLFFGISMLIAGCFWPVLSSTNLYSSFLSAKKDFRRNALYFDITGNLFPYACIIGTILITPNPVWLVMAYFASNTIIGIILYKKIVSIYKPNDQVDTEMITYSKHLSIIGILGTISNNIDQILVFHFIGPAELAIYNFAIAIPDQMKGPIKYLSNLVFPKFIERSDREIQYGMRNKVFYLFIASIILIIAYVTVAPFIFHIFFPKYTSSILYSQIFSLSFLWIISIPATVYLDAKKKIKELYVVNIVGSLLQIGLLFVGVIWGGLMGLVIARVLTRLFLSFINLFLYNSAVSRAVGVIN